MSNVTLNVIADRLADLYRGLRGVQVELSHQEADLAARILTLAGDGWPGKNDDQRKAAKENAIADDDVCRKINARLTELHDDLADAEGEIDALREQREALRWQIRERLAAALEAKYGIVASNHHEPVDSTFDGEQDAEAEAMAAEVDDPRQQYADLHAPGAVLVEENIPF